MEVAVVSFARGRRTHLARQARAVVDGELAVVALPANDGEGWVVKAASGADAHRATGRRIDSPAGVLPPGGCGVKATGDDAGMLTAEDALALCTAARTAAEELGVPMSFAVMDPGGHLVALLRMDGAGWVICWPCT